MIKSVLTFLIRTLSLSANSALLSRLDGLAYYDTDADVVAPVRRVVDYPRGPIARILLSNLMMS